jgi:MFS family permease
VLLYAGMGWIAEAMVESHWGLSSEEDSMITSVVFVGMLISAYFWCIVSDTYGKRQVIYLFYLFLYILLCSAILFIHHLLISH